MHTTWKRIIESDLFIEDYQLSPYPTLSIMPEKNLEDPITIFSTRFRHFLSLKTRSYLTALPRIPLL